MCIVALAWQLFEDKPWCYYPIGMNFCSVLRAHCMNGNCRMEKIIAGQDAQAGGTWLGIDPVHGRWG
ncbi:MAG: hypothetical protein U1E91_04320 [Moraxella sp.]